MSFFDAFGVDLPKLIFQIVNFLLLLYLANRFAFKPVLRILDERTLAFLAVNQSAVNHYGYSREEFLKMRAQDIRPTTPSAKSVPTLAIQGELRREFCAACVAKA